MDRRSVVFIILITLSFLGIRYYYDQKQEQALIEWKKNNPQDILEPFSHPKEPPSIQEPLKISPSHEAEPASNALYVLESPYQQIVISQKGGSIVEINLPFAKEPNQSGEVHAIYIDKELELQKNASAYFPYTQATRFDGSKVEPTLGGAYPLLRRSSTPGSTPLSSMLLFTSDDEFDKTFYQVTHFDQRSLVLEAQLPTRIIRKSFSFPADPTRYPYCLDVDIQIIGNKKDLMLSSGVPDNEIISGASGTTLKYRLVKGSKSEVISLDLPQTEFRSTSIQPDWAATSNGFFALIFDPIKGTKPGLSFKHISEQMAPSRLKALPEFAKTDLSGYFAQIPLDHTSDHFTARLFAGPLSDPIFSLIDRHSLEDGMEKPSNYNACISFHGWFSFISEPFSKFLYFLMSQCYKIIPSWTVAIIFATIILRIFMYPLTKWSQNSMLKMREIAPEVKAIQARYKKEPQKAQIEIMTLYRAKGVNPFSGCLPLLIQMPFLIGMFDLLKSTYGLRGASFIPGWIEDLSQPDRLFSFGFTIPFIGSYFHLLPILLAAVMWWQQKLSSPLPKDPANMTDAERQQRAMGNIMTVVMTVMFYHFPAGLNIYWLSSMLLSIAQQIWTNKQFSISKESVKKK